MLSKYRERIYLKYVSSQDQCADSTAHLNDFIQKAPSFKNLICKHFPEDKTSIIFDLGCGTGILIYFARKMGYSNISGIDISCEQIGIAKQLSIEGVKQGDLLQALQGLDHDMVDCIITYDVIEHFNRIEMLQLTDSVYNVLKHNGRWIIHAPNAESPFGMRIRYGDFTHELAFTRVSLSQVLLLAGFSKVDSYEDQPIPHGLKSFIRFLLWKVLRFLLWSYIAVETGSISRKSIFSQNFLVVAYK